MTKHLRLAVLIASLHCAATGAGSSEPGPHLLTPVAIEAPDQMLFAEAVMLRANAERGARGLPPLRYDPALAAAASDHARNMAALRHHSHVLPVPGQETYKRRLRRQGAVFRTAAENIARGKLYQLLGRPIETPTEKRPLIYAETGTEVPVHSYASLADEVVARWLASPSHAAALLSPGFTRVGAGLAGDPAAPAGGDLYMTQTLAD